MFRVFFCCAQECQTVGSALGFYTNGDKGAFGDSGLSFIGAQGGSCGKDLDWDYLGI